MVINRTVLKRLKVVEKHFCEAQERDESAEKVRELLREYEEIVEECKRDPNYVEDESQMAERLVAELKSRGLI